MTLSMPVNTVSSAFFSNLPSFIRIIPVKYKRMRKNLNTSGIMIEAGSKFPWISGNRKIGSVPLVPAMSQPELSIVTH